MNEVLVECLPVFVKEYKNMLPIVAVHRTFEISLTTDASDGHVFVLVASLLRVKLFPQAEKEQFD